ncbi:uncharacterized protein Pyn_24349 [Prunus yedoensis var. nudiflora]|uniref:Uncharacterized protein n=1 Tax=Prunus yedoensis var. nudiflora TaxID=2094558 RepID=A0A314YD08_PRUYE|nr:uncharacterized protein Pyn_24349 [Prunus yedoensis var. nudiflora]
MTVELGVAKGKRIRGLGSSLRVESSHSGGVASSFATQQKVEELQGTVGELKGTWMRTHDGPLPSHIGVPSRMLVILLVMMIKPTLGVLGALYLAT